LVNNPDTDYYNNNNNNNNNNTKHNNSHNNSESHIPSNLTKIKISKDEVRILNQVAELAKSVKQHSLRAEITKKSSGSLPNIVNDVLI